MKTLDNDKLSVESDNLLQVLDYTPKTLYSEKELSSRVINVTKTFYPCCACCRRGKVRAINHLHLGLEPNEKFG